MLHLCPHLCCTAIEMGSFTNDSCIVQLYSFAALLYQQSFVLHFCITANGNYIIMLNWPSRLYTSVAKDIVELPFVSVVSFKDLWLSIYIF